MNDREGIRQTIEHYVDSITSGDVESIPLTVDTEFQGAMMPQAVRGEAAVREHLRQVAPFIDMQVQQLIVEGDHAAAWLKLQGINGLEIQGAAFFEVRNGAIARNRAFFDTHALFTGQR